MGNTIQCGGSDRMNDSLVVPNSALVNKSNKCIFDPAKLTAAVKNTCTSDSEGITATWSSSDYPIVHFEPNANLCGQGTMWVENTQQCVPDPDFVKRGNSDNDQDNDDTCDRGSRLVDGTCKSWGGECAHGTLKAKSERTADNECESCDAGYRLVGSACEPWGGECLNGVTEPEQSLRTKENQCASCNDGFHLKNGECRGKISHKIDVSHPCGPYIPFSYKNYLHAGIIQYKSKVDATERDLNFGKDGNNVGQFDPVTLLVDSTLSEQDKDKLVEAHARANRENAPWMCNNRTVVRPYGYTSDIPMCWDPTIVRKNGSPVEWTAGCKSGKKDQRCTNPKEPCCLNCDTYRPGKENIECTSMGTRTYYNKFNANITGYYRYPRADSSNTEVVRTSSGKPLRWDDSRYVWPKKCEEFGKRQPNAKTSQCGSLDVNTCEKHWTTMTNANIEKDKCYNSDGSSKPCSMSEQFGCSHCSERSDNTMLNSFEVGCFPDKPKGCIYIPSVHENFAGRTIFNMDRFSTAQCSNEVQCVQQS